MAAETDWIRIAVDAAIGLGSGAASLLASAVHYGRRGAKREQKVKDDYDLKIGGLRDEVRSDMTRIEKSTNESRETLVGQFKESFDGIRRQFDEHRFSTEKDFMRKEDFRDFREEYREDMRELKATIAILAKQ